MKQTLVIGSTVIDVLLKVPTLPLRGEDINIESQEYRIGGCAYNVFKTLSQFNSPALLCSPVGTGIYAGMVREQLEAEGLNPFVLLEEENGCCYCLIEDDGERSFLSHHGAEYVFSRSWMKNIDYSKTEDFFICGLEVEEPTGDELIEFAFEQMDLKLYFAPGPRICHIPREKMERLLSRRDIFGKGPLLHLNEAEAIQYCGKKDYLKAADFLIKKTGNSVVITLGDRGCYFKENTDAEGVLVPPSPVKVIDTVGVGDAHCGALIACLKKGMKFEEACLIANKAAAAVAGIKGARLDRLPIDL